MKFVLIVAVVAAVCYLVHFDQVEAQDTTTLAPRPPPSGPPPSGGPPGGKGKGKGGKGKGGKGKGNKTRTTRSVIEDTLVNDDASVSGRVSVSSTYLDNTKEAMKKIDYSVDQIKMTANKVMNKTKGIINKIKGKTGASVSVQGGEASASASVGAKAS